jgi:hypothetical protein
MNRTGSLDLIGTSAVPEPGHRQAHAENGLSHRQTDPDPMAAAIVEQVRGGQGSTDHPEKPTGEHHAPSVASVHEPHPTQPQPPRHANHYPPPHHPAWIAFMDGYLAGITHGIGIGRAQVSQELTDAETFPNETPRTASYEALSWAREGLSRAEWIERQKAEHAAREIERYARIDEVTPPQSAEQIRENAFRSWGLTDLSRCNAA